MPRPQCIELESAQKLPSRKDNSLLRKPDLNDAAQVQPGPPFSHVDREKYKSTTSELDRIMTGVCAGELYSPSSHITSTSIQHATSTSPISFGTDQPLFDFQPHEFTSNQSQSLMKTEHNNSWLSNGQLTPTSSTRAHHHRKSSLSSLGSAGPASPYTANISNPQVAGDLYNEFHDFQYPSCKPWYTPIPNSLPTWTLPPTPYAQNDIFVQRLQTVNNQRLSELQDQTCLTSPEREQSSFLQGLVCPTCNKSVKTYSKLKKHDLRHRKPFVCKVQGCPRTEGFSTTNDLDRHTKNKHPLAIPETTATKNFRCNVLGCKSKDKLWPRLDNFWSHLKRVHQNQLKTEEDYSEMIRRSEYFPLAPTGNYFEAWSKIPFGAVTQEDVDRSFSEFPVHGKAVTAPATFQEIINSRVFKSYVGEDMDGSTSEFSIHEDAIAQLSQRSETFTKGDLPKAQAGEAIWKDVSKDTFERFAQFAYTGDYSILKTKKRDTDIRVLNSPSSPRPRNAIRGRRGSEGPAPIEGALQKQLRTNEQTMPKTISPKDVDLFYHESDEETRGVRPQRHYSPPVRTTKQQSQTSVLQMPTSAPPRHYPVYPIPIPPEKRAKTLQLYQTYQRTKALVQSQSESQSFFSNPQSYVKPQTYSKTASFKRKAVEVVLNGVSCLARPDSGSDRNIMTEDCAKECGVPIMRGENDTGLFKLGTGKNISSIGRAYVPLNLLGNNKSKEYCWFDILAKCSVPLILGLEFVRKIQLYTKNKHLLVESPFNFSMPTLKWIGTPKGRIEFVADGKALMGGTDTGSDLDFMSLACARRRGFKIDRRENVRTRVMLPDQTIVETIGQVYISSLQISDFESFEMTFHVLPGLSCDTIFGEEFLEQMDAFNACDILDGEEDPSIYSLHTLINLGPIQSFLARKCLTETLTSEEDSLLLEHDAGIEAEIYRRNKTNRSISKIKNRSRAEAAREEEKAKRRLFDRGHENCVHCSVEEDPGSGSSST